MSQLWAAVASLQRGLDEAAGITTVQGGAAATVAAPQTPTPSRAGFSASGAPSNTEATPAIPFPREAEPVIPNSTPHDHSDAGASPPPLPEEQTSDSPGPGRPPASNEQELALALQQANARNEEMQMQLQALRAVSLQMAEELEQMKQGTSNREVALQREGQELSQSLGKAHQRNRLLSEELERMRGTIAALEDKVTHLSQKEAQWRDSVKSAVQTETAFHEQSRALQRTVHQQLEEIAALQQLNVELAEGKAELERSISDLRQTSHEAANAAKSNAEAEITALHMEAERAREVRRRDAVEWDRKLGRLEKELSEAHQRAHEAELRAVVIERGVPEATLELRQQLAEQEARIEMLQGRLEDQECGWASDRNQLMSAKQMLSAETELRHEREVETAAALAEFKRRQQALEAELAKAQTRCALMEKEMEERRRSSERLAQSGAHPAPRPSDADRAPPEERPPTEPVRRSGSGVGVGVGAAFAASEQRAPVASQPWAHIAPAVPPAAPPPPQSRVERELVRLQVEVSEATRLKGEHATLLQQHAALAKQHDVLLQMFGAQEEQLAELRETLATSKAAYRAQIEALSRRSGPDPRPGSQ